jgi:hypothetical protein
LEIVATATTALFSGVLVISGRMLEQKAQRFCC